MFSFVVLPDFQCYCDIRIKIAQSIFKVPDQREMMTHQVNWVRQNIDRLGIKMVFQEGDLTQTNHPEEWALSEAALRQLDAVVPYMVCVGNHDMGYEASPPPGKFWVSNRRDSLLHDYFPPARFQNNPLYQYGGNFEGRSENYFLLFEAEGLRFLALTLEFMPRDAALSWANEVVAAHPDRRCIVMTHGFLDCRGRRDLRSEMYPIEGNSAEAIWHKFVCRHANVFLVLSGHDYGEARRTDLGRHGNAVHQLMANYQWWENGGLGWLRILTFHPAEDRIDVQTYTPVRDRFRVAPASQFSLRYPMRRDPSRYADLTPLHLRKLTHLFRLFDADASGSVELADFMVLRDRLANMRGLDFDHPSYAALEVALNKLWRLHVGPDAAPRLTSEEFLEHWSANLGRVQRGPAELAAVVAEIDDFLDSLWAIVDANGDGAIGCVEFILFLKALGVDHGQISTFRSLDSNGDGDLTHDELRVHAREFFLGSNPASPSNHLFGLLHH